MLDTAFHRMSTTAELLPLLGLFVRPAGAQVLVKNGAHFQVNTSPATDHASQSDVTFETNGHTTVVYVVRFNEHNEIWVRRFDSAGTPVGSEQLVAAIGAAFAGPQVLPLRSTPGSQVFGPWASGEIWASLFSENGDVVPPTNLFLTSNGEVGLTEAFPRVTSRASDESPFAATFVQGATVRLEVGTTTRTTATQWRDKGIGVTATRVVWLGAVLGSHVPRTMPTPPSFLVAEEGSDLAGGFIQGRFFDEVLNKIGSEFRISPASLTGFKIDLALAATPSGIAMAVWQEVSSRRLNFVLVDAQGPIGDSALLVSSNFGAARPAIATVGELFLVTWDQGGTNGDPDTILARWIDASDPTAPILGPEVEVSGTTATSYRDDPAISADDRGNVVILWTERSPDQTDSNILAQRLRLERDPIFSDDFELGSTSAWSVQVP